MKKLILILVSLALFLLLPSQGLCFEVAALVSKNKISINNSIILRITVKDGKGDIDTSVIKDFKVVSQGSSTSVSIINTSYSKIISHTYLLFPLKKGTLTIPKIEVNDGNKTASTKKITIIVTDEVDDESVSNYFFAKVSISDSTLFTGQEAIYTFKLFSAANFFEARLREPEFKFFSVKKLGKKDNYTKNINGKVYTVNEINYLVTPEKPGNHTIEPASVTMQIPIEEDNNSNFGINSFFSPRKTIKTISSNSINIEVLSLPVYDGKEDYNGLIGNFIIHSDLNKTELQVGESATLTLAVSGRGNIMDTSIENINLPQDSFKIYDDKPEKKEELNSKGYLKKKIFKKAIVPLKPGNFIIPEISILYFDTKSEEYKKIATKPIDIVVTKSNTNDRSNIQVSGNEVGKEKIKKKEVKFTGRDILPLKQTADVLKTQKSLNFYLFISLIIFPFILFCLINFFKRLQKKAKPNSIIMKQKAVNALKKAKDPKLSQDEFLNHIRNAVVSSILSKGNITGESLTEDEASKILQKSDLKEREVENTLKTFKDIESAKYGGGSLEKNKREELFFRAKNMIKLCSLIIFTISFLSFMPIKAQANQTDESGTMFLEGVEDYKAGSFEKAAHNFEQIALDGIKNGKLYYNIANAFLKAEDLGKAVLWYERAKKLMPFDADLKFNLDYTQEKLKDIKNSKSLDLTDILFFWKNHFSSDMIRYFAIFLSFVFFSYASIRVLSMKKILTTSATLVLILFLLVLSTALFDYYQVHNTNSAVIIPEKVSVRSGLSEDSTELFILHAGTKVKVDEIKKGFLRISFSKGKLGWVKKGDAIII
jgi:tetratricopeptide (TPR) repeat protein